MPNACGAPFSAISMSVRTTTGRGFDQPCSTDTAIESTVQKILPAPSRLPGRADAPLLSSRPRRNTGSNLCQQVENKMKKPMRILFLTSAHNSLSQRLWIELGELGHEIRVCVAATGEAMIAAVSREAPHLIIAPMLKIAIPAEVWSRHLCLIVHPGGQV